MNQGRIKAAMVMTAGLGTRLRPFTNVRTKALLPVLGIPAAQYTIDSLSLVGVERFVTNVHHLAQDTTQRLQALDLNDAELRIKDESALILGTAGGIQNALGDLGPGPFFRANADVICDLDWDLLWNAHQKLRKSHGVVITLAVFRNGPRGAKYPEILFDPSSSLMTGIGQPQENQAFWTGAAVIEPEALSGVPKQGPSEFVPTILAPAIGEKKAGVFITDGLWCDIGAPELWLETQLQILNLFEQRENLGPILNCWQKRFSRVNFCFSQGCWGHRSHQPMEQSLVKRLRGPCYVGEGFRVEMNHSRVGPNTVVYEAPSESSSLGSSLENAIAFGGYCVKK